MFALDTDQIRLHIQFLSIKSKLPCRGSHSPKALVQECLRSTTGSLNSFRPVIDTLYHVDEQLRYRRIDTVTDQSLDACCAFVLLKTVYRQYNFDRPTRHGSPKQQNR